MHLKKTLLGTTALLGAGAVMIAAAGEASALDVKVAGYGQSGVVFGDTDEASGAPGKHGLYFRNEFEVHVRASGKDDATGLEYGAAVEFQSDNSTADVSTDEEWLYIKGGWGELRFGDNDGPADDMKVTAANIAAGTGGIDGWDEVALVGIYLENSSDATKIIYFSPVVGGFQLGVSYTPDAGHFAGGTFPTTLSGFGDWLEAAATFTTSVSGVDLILGAGFSTAKDQAGSVGDDFTGYGVGAQVGFAGVSVAGSWARNDFDVSGDSDRWTIGAGASLGPANLSVTYVKQNNSNSTTDPDNLVFSATVGLFPGMALQGDVALFDRDTGTDDDGMIGVARLNLSF
jgi:hypothetical protein